MRLTIELESTGGNTAGFRIPDDVVEELGGGRRPKVVASVGEYTWRSSIARMGDSFWLGMSQANRAAAGVSAGATLALDLALDDAPRVVEVPDDLAAALAADPVAAAAWTRLSHTRQKEVARGLLEAKRPETRAGRLEKALASLRR